MYCFCCHTPVQNMLCIYLFTYYIDENKCFIFNILFDQHIFNVHFLYTLIYLYNI